MLITRLPVIGKNEKITPKYPARKEGGNKLSLTEYFEKCIIWIPDYAKMLPENMIRMDCIENFNYVQIKKDE